MESFAWYRKLIGGLWVKFEYVPFAFYASEKDYTRGRKQHFFWTQDLSWFGKRFCWAQEVENDGILL